MEKNNKNLQDNNNITMEDVRKNLKEKLKIYLTDNLERVDEITIDEETSTGFFHVKSKDGKIGGVGISYQVKYDERQYESCGVNNAKPENILSLDISGFNSFDQLEKIEIYRNNEIAFTIDTSTGDLLKAIYIEKDDIIKVKMYPKENAIGIGSYYIVENELGQAMTAWRKDTEPEEEGGEEKFTRTEFTYKPSVEGWRCLKIYFRDDNCFTFANTFPHGIQLVELNTYIFSVGRGVSYVDLSKLKVKFIDKELLCDESGEFKNYSYSVDDYPASEWIRLQRNNNAPSPFYNFEFDIAEGAGGKEIVVDVTYDRIRYIRWFSIISEKEYETKNLIKTLKQTVIPYKVEEGIATLEETELE